MTSADNKNEILYKTKPAITPNIIRVIFIILIGLCIYNFNLNPRAFSIFTGVLGLFLIFVRSVEIQVREDRVIFFKKSTIPIIRKKFVFKYVDLQEVFFYKSKWEFYPDHDPISAIIPVKSGKYLRFVYKNGTEKTFEEVNLRWKDVKQLMHLINEKIKENNSISKDQ